MSQHSYLDFDLLIEHDVHGDYRARILKSPVGEIASVPIRLPFSDLELENFLLRIGRPRHRSVRGMQPQEVADVRNFGAQLFDAVFQGRLRTALAGSLDHVEGLEDTGLRVRLRLSDCPELSDLPWEYLYSSDARRFLALSEWTPVVRYLELQGRIRPLAVNPPLRILVMAASPSDFEPLDALQEWMKISQALDDLQQQGRVELDRVPSGSLSDLRRKLMRNQYHVFHFIGHGRYDDDAQDGVLALEGPSGRAHLVTGTDLGVLLHDHRSLRLAILNSCEGARGGLNDPYSGTAQSLIYQAIPAVVAMQFEITDNAAISFAHSLYETVANGYPLDAAMAAARNAIRDDANPLEWATPVLYLRAPDGRIFDVPEDGFIPARPLLGSPYEPPVPNASDSHAAISSMGADDSCPPQIQDETSRPVNQIEHSLDGPRITDPIPPVGNTGSKPYSPAPSSGTGWGARMTRNDSSVWRFDWRVDVWLSEEQHSIEYRDLSIRKGMLRIDGVMAGEIHGFSAAAIADATYQLSDGGRTRSLHLSGSWCKPSESVGAAVVEVWVDNQLLLQQDLLHKALKEQPSIMSPSRAFNARVTNKQVLFKTKWSVELTLGAKAHILLFDHTVTTKLCVFVDGRLHVDQAVDSGSDRQASVRLILNDALPPVTIDATVDFTQVFGKITRIALRINGEVVTLE
jgi:hypothetical protein